MKEKITKLWFSLRQKPALTTILASLLSIFLGIIFGLIVLMVLDISNSFYGFSQMLTAGASSLRKIGKVLYTATPFNDGPCCWLLLKQDYLISGNWPICIWAF